MIETITGDHLTESELQEFRLQNDDHTYYSILTNERLVEELHYHLTDTLEDRDLMEVKDLRNFWIKRCSTMVKVLYERAMTQ